MPVERYTTQNGFTLIETVVIILVIGILSSVAITKLNAPIETAKAEHTKAELEQIAYAIAGEPSAYSSGSQAVFGYVGDVGGLPANLSALVTNPGGYSTWNGPYLQNSLGDLDYQRDAWGVNYQLIGTLIRSTGSGSNIDRSFAAASSDLLQNSVTGVIHDANGQPPGATYKDSTAIRLAYGNGSGAMTTVSTTPSGNGNFSFANVPIGVHTLTVIYTPASDTLTWQVTIYPRKTARLDLTFAADIY